MSAYISNELSNIKAHDHDRHLLADMTAQYLALGGKITGPETAPPKPYGRDYKGVNIQRQSVKREADEQAARIRELAKTLNAIEICEREGLLRGNLRGIAKRYGIEFTVGRKNTYTHNKVTPESEALMVIQIKEGMAKGLNRTKCHEAMGISSTLFLRLIKDYAIDYPKMKSAFR